MSGMFASSATPVKSQPAFTTSPHAPTTANNFAFSQSLGLESARFFFQAAHRSRIGGGSANGSGPAGGVQIDDVATEDADEDADDKDDEDDEDDEELAEDEAVDVEEAELGLAGDEAVAKGREEHDTPHSCV